MRFLATEVSFDITTLFDDFWDRAAVYYSPDVIIWPDVSWEIYLLLNWFKQSPLNVVDSFLESATISETTLTETKFTIGPMMSQGINFVRKKSSLSVSSNPYNYKQDTCLLLYVCIFMMNISQPGGFS